MNDQAQTEPQGPTEQVLTVHGLQFSIPAPYFVGKPIETEGEASNFNQTYKEAISNGVRAKIAKFFESNNVQASDVASDEGLKQQIADSIVGPYVQSHRFTARTGGDGGFRGDPVMKEAMAIARKKVKEAARAQNKTLEAKDVTRYAEMLVNHPEKGANILATARAIVKKQHEAADAIELDL